LDFTRRKFIKERVVSSPSNDRQLPRDRPIDDRAVVRREMCTVQTDGIVVYSSDAIRSVLDQVHLVAPTNATVLLLGETGVGKEVIAQAIHDASPRGRRPMISVNCGAIPSELMERELFGHERGAFTDAGSRQIGQFEAANGSTLFLDEISELPLDMQVKFLRVLQERTIERLGSPVPIKVDVRIIAATNKNLEQAMMDKTFRQDLFYRLNVFPITIPPLRERIDDIPALAWTFIDELSGAFGKKIDAISSDRLMELQQYPWPGNVRELRNLIEREMVLAQGATLTPTVPVIKETSPVERSARLIDVQKAHIRAVLESCAWRVRGASGAAHRLGVKPTTLESQMARLGISRQGSLPRPRTAVSW
jgi:formate hydrogenlyase transcriptional activator